MRVIRNCDALIWEGLGVYLVAIGSLAFLLPQAIFARVAAESGPFEQLSLALWLLMACLVLWRSPRPRLGVVAIVVVVLLCAAREADWHKAFTGYSVLKLSFYLKEQYAWHQRLAFAAIVLTGAACGFVLLAKGWQRLVVEGEHRLLWARLTIMAVVLAVISKTCDRLPELGRENLGIDWPQFSLRLLKIYEEGIEFVVPLLFILAVTFESRERLGTAAPVGQDVLEY